MGIFMKLAELIDAASKHSRQSQLQIAGELGIKPARISEWKSGVRTPDANEIAFFADKAGLPVIQTVAEIEAELYPQYASLWKRAVSELRQNQGLSLLLSLGRKIRHKLQAKQRQKRKARYGPFSIRRAKGRVQLYCRRRGDVPDASFDRSPSE